MPTTPLRPCARAGCPELVRVGHCPAHRPRPARTAAERGYGTAWRGARLAVLQDEPLCRECRRVGVVRLARPVDHIVPKANGGTDDRANLQPLCDAHHIAKTQRERAEREGRSP